MAGIQSSAVSSHIVKQTSPSSGVPATPAFLEERRTTFDITKTLSFDKSGEAKTDRQAGQNEIISSEINSALSSEVAIADPAFHLRLESLMQNEFPADLGISATTIAFDNGTSKITDSANGFTAIQVGYFIKVGGSTDADNNIVYQVTAKAGDGDITVSPAPASTQVAGDTITINGQNLRNGANQVAFTQQKRIPYTGGTEYQTFEGVQQSSMTINTTTGSLLTLDHTALGLTKLSQTTAVAGQTDVAPDTSRILGPVAGVPQFWVDNVPTLPTAINVQEANVTIDQGASSELVVGKEGAACLTFADQISVTGSLNTITNAAADTELAKFEGRTTFAFAIELTNVNGDTLIIERPQCLYTDFTQAPAAGELLKNVGTIDAEEDSTLGYTVQITYIAAP